MRKTTVMFTMGLTGFGALLVAASHLSAQSSGGSIIPVTSTSTILGQQLPNLTADQTNAFLFGLQKFVTTETPADGLGPLFNGTSCGECHVQAAVGGAGTNLGIAQEVRCGAVINGVYSDLLNEGGPVFEKRSLQEFDLNNPVAPDHIPADAQYVSLRITTPLFGLGLLEAIPDDTIRANATSQANNPMAIQDGIHGEANMVTNPENGQIQIGRFGWKAQVSRLHVFAGDAYLNEMGVTSPFFPNEKLPMGHPIPPGGNPDPTSPNDDGGDVQAFADFMRFLAPPAPKLPITLQIQAGAQVFTSLRCGICHVPLMHTAPNVTATISVNGTPTVVSVPALSNQTVRAFTDLLLHDMGAGLADGIRQPATASARRGYQFRTAPLWGLGRRKFFLHDGRATDIEDAIEAHGGEATAARNRFLSLNATDFANLMAFLRDL